MSLNLVVWKWAPAYDSAAKRKALGVTVPDVISGFLLDGKHPGMIAHDFEAFEQKVFADVGPEVVDGPYVLERSACARVFNLPFATAPVLVPKIGMLARALGLTSAEA